MISQSDFTNTVNAFKTDKTTYHIIKLYGSLSDDIRKSIGMVPFYFGLRPPEGQLDLSVNYFLEEFTKHTGVKFNVVPDNHDILIASEIPEVYVAQWLVMCYHH